MKKKCPSCAEKIEKGFSYCPWCGASQRDLRNKKKYGILGKDDNIDDNMVSQELKLPFGLDKIANSLIKQLDKEMKNLGDSAPRDFKINIRTGIPPNMLKRGASEREPKEVIKITPQEEERRSKLPKKIAKSKVRRFSDSIIYEIDVDEIKDRTQVDVAKLENGFEIKVFGKDHCFVKSIPLKMKLIGYKFSKDKVMVEFKE